MLTPGDDVELNPDGTVAAGSGLKLELYTAHVATKTFPAVPVVGQTTTPFSTLRPAVQADVDGFSAAIFRIKEECASLANVYGAVICSHISTNAKAKVTTEVLGRTPNPLAPDTDIQPPSGTVLIPIE